MGGHEEQSSGDSLGWWRGVSLLPQWCWKAATYLSAAVSSRGAISPPPSRGLSLLEPSYGLPGVSEGHLERRLEQPPEEGKGASPDRDLPYVWSDRSAGFSRVPTGKRTYLRNTPQVHRTLGKRGRGAGDKNRGRRPRPSPSLSNASRLALAFAVRQAAVQGAEEDKQTGHSEEASQDGRPQDPGIGRPAASSG